MSYEHPYKSFDPETETIVAFFDRARTADQAAGAWTRISLQKKFEALGIAYGVPEETADAYGNMYDGLFDIGLPKNDAEERQRATEYTEDTIKELPTWISGLTDGGLHKTFVETAFGPGAKPAPNEIAQTWVHNERHHTTRLGQWRFYQRIAGTLVIAYLSKMEDLYTDHVLLSCQNEDLRAYFTKRQIDSGVSPVQASKRLFNKGPYPFNHERLERQLQAFTPIANFSTASHLYFSATTMAILGPAEEDTMHNWFTKHGTASLHDDNEAFAPAASGLFEIYRTLAENTANPAVATAIRHKAGDLRKIIEGYDVTFRKAIRPLTILLQRYTAVEEESKPDVTPAADHAPTTPEVDPAVLATLRAEIAAFQTTVAAFNAHWSLTASGRNKYGFIKPLARRLQHEGYVLGDEHPVELIPPQPEHEAFACGDLIALLGGFVVRQDQEGQRISYEAQTVQTGIQSEQQLNTRRRELLDQIAGHKLQQSVTVTALPLPLGARMNHLRHYQEGYSQLIPEVLAAQDIHPDRIDRHMGRLAAALQEN